MARLLLADVKALSLQNALEQGHRNQAASLQSRLSHYNRIITKKEPHFFFQSSLHPCSSQFNFILEFSLSGLVTPLFESWLAP